MKKRNFAKHAKFVKKTDAFYLYGVMPVWKATIKLGVTGILMSFFLGLFTFADQLILVNFMPDTLRFCFDSLFFTNSHDVFLPILNHIHEQALTNPQIMAVYDYILSQRGTKGQSLHDLVEAIANLNGLGVYNSDSIVRSAVSLTVAISDIIYVLPSLYSIGVSVKYSQALGAQDYKKAIYIWQNSFYGTTVITLIGTVIMFILIPTVVPAQATMDYVSDSTLAAAQNHISDVLSTFGYNNSDFLHTTSNNEVLQTYYFSKVGDKFEYFIKVAPNLFINVNTHDLLNLTPGNFSQYAQHLNLSTQDSFSLKLVNYSNYDDPQNITIIWNNYFNVVRVYSIVWAEDFLFIIAAGLIISSVTNLLLTILRSDGVILMTTLMTVIPIIITIILDYVFIVYAQIGMDGAGCGTVLGWSMELIWAMLYLRFSKHLDTHISWTVLRKRYLNITKKYLWELLMYGGTVFIGNIGWMITDLLNTTQVTVVSNILLKNTGSEYYLSIIGAILPITNLFVVAIISFIQFISPLFSFNYAAHNYKRFRHAYWDSNVFTGFFTIISYVIICLIPQVNTGILGWFKITSASADLELLSAVKLLKIWFIQVPSFTLAMGGILCYLSSNRPGLSTWIGLIRSCILFIPILYIFSAVSLNNPGSFNAGLSAAQISNPYYNNAMWFFLWSTPVAYLSANFVVLVMSTCYIYIYVQHPPRHVIDCKPFVWFKDMYIDYYLDESQRIAKQLR